MRKLIGLFMLLVVVSVIGSACGATYESTAETQEAVSHWGLSRPAFENHAGAGFPSTMVPNNCLNDPGDPGHWNCVSSVVEAEDRPYRTPISDSFVGELCVSPLNGGAEWFYLDESAGPVHGHGAVTAITSVAVAGTLWVWGLHPGQSDSIQVCVWRHGVTKCNNFTYNYNTQQAGAFPLWFTSAFPKDPSTNQPWDQQTAFGDDVLADDITVGITHEPHNYNICFGAVWLDVSYDTQF